MFNCHAMHVSFLSQKILPYLQVIMYIVITCNTSKSSRIGLWQCFPKEILVHTISQNALGAMVLLMVESHRHLMFALCVMVLLMVESHHHLKFALGVMVLLMVESHRHMKWWECWRLWMFWHTNFVCLNFLPLPLPCEIDNSPSDIADKCDGQTDSEKWEYFWSSIPVSIWYRGFCQPSKFQMEHYSFVQIISR